MSYSARDLIAGSLRLIGAIATGETPSAAEQSDALLALNDMLDSWSIEGLVVPNKVRETITLVPGQTAYTMGPSGTPDLTTVRPIEITSALIQLAGSSPLTELPLELLNQEQYAEIRIKPIQSTIPTKLYAENTNPNETINLWPVPSTANVLVLYSMKALTGITAANISAQLSFLPGYQRALRYNLAVEIAPEFGKSVTPEIAAVAAESKGNIKRRNIRESLLKCDAAVLDAGRNFNFYTGGIR